MGQFLGTKDAEVKAAMLPDLTRRRMQDVHQITCLIFYDVASARLPSGAVSRLTSTWGWSLGFFPKSERPAEIRSGTAATFDRARAAFELEWQDYLPTCNEQDFLAYRQRRAREAWKHAMWAAPALLPTQTADGRSRCFCGAEITIATTEPHIYEAHMDLGWE